MKMLVGLTGKTGSGKSCAAKIFKELGCFVADCDKVAHEVLLEKNVKDELCAIFTDSILDENGEIDRKKLGCIVFSDKQKLVFLNKIVHSFIVERCVNLCEQSGKDICLMDGSELESSGADKLCRYIVVVTADEKTRLKRIMERDLIDEEAALKRIRSQSDYSKEAIVLENEGGEEELRKKTTALYNRFLGEINV